MTNIITYSLLALIVYYLIKSKKISNDESTQPIQFTSLSHLSTEDVVLFFQKDITELLNDIDNKQKENEQKIKNYISSSEESNFKKNTNSLCKYTHDINSVFNCSIKKMKNIYDISDNINFIYKESLDTFKKEYNDIKTKVSFKDKKDIVRIEDFHLILIVYATELDKLSTTYNIDLK